MQNVDDPVNRVIRRRIRRIRKSKNISVRKAAMLCNIPESSYSCMENGFYRISLRNLNKMLTGLGVAIEDVWPRQQQNPGESSSFSPIDQSYFRFHEICLLSRSKKAALLRGSEHMRFVYAINMGEDEKAELRAMIKTYGDSDWKIYTKKNGEIRVGLCLLAPALPKTVESLVGIYLDMWLAAGFAEGPLQ